MSLSLNAELMAFRPKPLVKPTFLEEKALPPYKTNTFYFVFEKQYLNVDFAHGFRTLLDMPEPFKDYFDLIDWAGKLSEQLKLNDLNPPVLLSQQQLDKLGGLLGRHVLNDYFLVITAKTAEYCTLGNS
ncbi:hypothetical protein ACFBZI_11210 [Moraxella sp. ZJ142]|uniref:hypothetical protein n=1 Tax=Moraxella marmotae TaxID=3344520 RepID=UPI0035D4D489